MSFYEDDVKQEILRKYRKALIKIGIDFSNEEVRYALEDCDYGFEEALISAISYVVWLKQNNKEITSVNDILIKALYNMWKPKYWKEEYLELPMFETEGDKWWKEAAIHWGQEVRNRVVADISMGCGVEIITFTNDTKITVDSAYARGWKTTLECATD
ncbi:hypothetical protein BV378_03075 [Nostoc sp. RF31YmG]|nr:hypothetical protein BV378_03075 [Nostoc sp. RF31YmG]